MRSARTAGRPSTISWSIPVNVKDHPGHCIGAVPQKVPACKATVASSSSASTTSHSDEKQHLQPVRREPSFEVLNTSSPEGKAALTHRAWCAYTQGGLPLKRHLPSALAPPDRPARPDKPALVPAKQVPSYDKDQPLPLGAYMLHNLAHIELNAIDLAWDTVARFAHLDLPAAFYEDFARVADDESRHLGWCLQRLQELGQAYGDMPAHDLLWEGAQMSAHDLNARLAIVPMSQEARGLDAGSRLVQRLRSYGDKRSAGVVAQIAEEEHAHVAVGVAWFQRTCAALELPAGAQFRQWLGHLCPDLLKGPFAHELRNQVGLRREWYDTSMWPEHLKAQLAPPAKAAALRGRGEQPPRALPPPLLTTEQLQQLKARLEHMLDLEASRAA